MIIGLLTVRLFIPESRSLKEKRRVIKSLKDKLRHRFNISISEVAQQDKWQAAELAIAYVSTENAHVQSEMSKILNFIDDEKTATITGHQIEVL